MDTNPYAPPLGLEQKPYSFAPQTSFGAILNSGLRLYAANFPAIATVTMIVSVPTELFQSYMDYFVFEADDLRSSFRLQQALEGFFGIIATAAVIAIEESAVRDERISVWEAIGKGISAWPRMFWTNLVRGILLFLALLALIVPFFYVIIRLALAETVAVIEYSSGGKCMQRTWDLANGRYWTLLGLLGGSSAAVILLGIGMSVPMAIFPEMDHWLVGFSISLFVDIVGQIITSLMVAAYFAFARDASHLHQSVESVANVVPAS